MDEDKDRHKYGFGSHDGSDQTRFSIFQGKKAEKLTKEKKKTQGCSGLDILWDNTIDCEERVGQEADGHQNI